MPDPKRIVIKYGGSLFDDPGHRAGFLSDVAALSKHRKVVLLHGGGREITQALKRSGLPTRFVGGRRVTDERALAVVEQVLALINDCVVGDLNQRGAGAAGFSGKTDCLVQADPIPELGRVGAKLQVNRAKLEKVLQGTRLPVFYSIAVDKEGEPLNINTDDFALALAIACRAERLVFLTDAGAVLDSAGKPLPLISSSMAERLIASHAITGGMLVKARAGVEALAKGVGRVDICKGIKPLVKTDLPFKGTSFVTG